MQRPDRPVPRLGPAGAGPGHGTGRHARGRRWTVDIRDGRWAVRARLGRSWPTTRVTAPRRESSPCSPSRPRRARSAAPGSRNRAMTDRMKIVVSGPIAGVPDQGGAAWAVLQWVLGLRRLGHLVILVEQVAAQRFEALCHNSPARRAVRAGGVRGADRRFGGNRAGHPRAELVHAVQGADLLLNISGSLTDAGLLGAVRRRVFVDLDPAFTQLWHDPGHRSRTRPPRCVRDRRAPDRHGPAVRCRRAPQLDHNRAADRARALADGD